MRCILKENCLCIAPNEGLFKYTKDNVLLKNIVDWEKKQEESLTKM